MFRENDIVYFNGKEYSGDISYDWNSGLTLNKPYLIIEVYKSDDMIPITYPSLGWIRFVNDNNEVYSYHSDRFMSLKKYRTQKLQRICLKEVI